MAYKIVFFIFLSLLILLFSGCTSAKYIGPHMAEIDKTVIKMVSEKDVENAVYLKLRPSYGYKIDKNDIVTITKHNAELKAFTKREFENYNNAYIDIWIVYDEINRYAIPSYKVPPMQNKKTKLCRHYTSDNLYMCDSRYFLYDESGDIVDNEVILHAIAMNQKQLNKEGALYKKWLLAGFTSFKNVRTWIKIDKTPKEAKLWIDLGVPSSVAKNYTFDEYISSCYEYNLSLSEVKKWIKVKIYNPSIINFLKYNGYTYESFKYRTLRDALNSMKLDDFFKMMNIQDIRVINGYLYHWKYNTNYKRFHNILKRYYGI